MKCTSCGNTNLAKTHLPMNANSYGEVSSISSDVDVFLCLDCGHYELFSMKTVMAHREAVAKIKDIECEIDELHQKLKKLQDPEETQKINSEIERIEAQLQSLDITIRQQRKLKEKACKLREKARRIPYEIASIQEQIKERVRDIEAARRFVLTKADD